MYSTMKILVMVSFQLDRIINYRGGVSLQASVSEPTECERSDLWWPSRICHCGIVNREVFYMIINSYSNITGHESYLIQSN